MTPEYIYAIYMTVVTQIVNGDEMTGTPENEVPAGTTDILVTDIPVWVAQVIQRVADREKRTRLAQIRHVLQMYAERVISREQRGGGGGE